METRLEEITIYLKAPMEERFYLSCGRIEQMYNMQYQKIWDSLKKMFTSLFMKTIHAQAEGKKEAIHYLAIQYLHSSLCIGTWGYRIETFDADLYLNEYETEEYYYPYFLYSFWEEDIEFLHNVLKKEYIRIQAYEIEEIKTNYILYYNGIFKNLLKELIPKIFKIPLWDEVKKESNVKIIFGEYMGTGELIKTEESTNE